ncbi:TetR/AcrR family transcriptional regulator [Cedecea sp.]|jgi:AcrR family transcriptional regulator|uniref:TetR/AcrR family transcriptional regulator n=1 Tax=Cedecea sp. TaxID=1970739 RepID=UPI002F40694C
MKEAPDTLRSKILSGAIELFIEKGVEKVTTRELTERVGISRSHIYHYFRDWQTLCIEAMTEFLMADLHRFTDETLALSPENKLQRLIHIYLPHAPDAVWQLYGALWHQAAHSSLWAELALLMTQKWEKVLADIVDDGIKAGVFRAVDAARTTRQFSALLNGYADKLLVASAPADRQLALDDIDGFIGLVLRAG